MKIAISYPPIESPKGTPLLAQNRQFQYFNAPTYIYPVVPAYAATALKKAGYEVVWDDAIAERKRFEPWLDELKRSDIDLIAVESKTPVIKAHWRIIDRIKESQPDRITVLMGDHVTAMPEESMQNCAVDYVLTGGNYDLSLLNLVRHLTEGEPLGPGFYYRDGGAIRSSGHFEQKGSLHEIPMLDRDLTKWSLYAYHNGNYKYLPGTYTMAGRDCWWRKDGGCTFCSWTTIFPRFQVMTPDQLLEEVDVLIHKYGVKEIFDDTGTFPGGAFLQKFCEAMIQRGFNRKIKFGCNMKPGALNQEQYNLMGRAGFRFILYGVESGNDQTLERLNKGNTVQDIRDSMRMAKKAGLEPHVTCMVGYPWETKAQAQQTIDLCKDLFQRGWIDTLQATITIPYPGTQLFKQCRENGWLLHEDWDRYDMREQVMVSELTTADVLELSQQLYKSFVSPRYIARKVASVRSVDDVKFLGRAAWKVVGHLKDFALDNLKFSSAGTASN
ncbi:MAG: B12-binding domain-containing radical SAM protein [Acidobacteria bacterium]|nr:B12-binding domain-containing radical SAM protein [Acidobacteriota bacterium]